MCTVTYIPLKNKIILTSNRDEMPNRAAEKIFKENTNNCSIYYPKDATKSGTWFAISENGNTIILLNGAFENHVKKENYRKSRGLIVLDLIAKEYILEAMEVINLKDIEPFTLIIFEKKILAEFRWDGLQKHFQILDSKQAYIWSSATLYDKKTQAKRNQLFENFLQKEDVNEESIWNFHHEKSKDLENGITIKRKNTIQTISTTQVTVSSEIHLQHSNRLTNNTEFLKIFLRNECQA